MATFVTICILLILVLSLAAAFIGARALFCFVYRKPGLVAACAAGDGSLWQVSLATSQSWRTGGRARAARRPGVRLPQDYPVND